MDPLFFAIAMALISASNPFQGVLLAANAPGSQIDSPIEGWADWSAHRDEMV